MLLSFSIKNFALIEELVVGFGKGLNIITGETGAGKSIIIDALSLILGERADTDAIRKGAEKAVVEAQFEVAGNRNLKQLFQQNEIEFQNELILRREVSLKGQSRCFINDTPSTTTMLKHVGDLLVDLHGQHEHQSLLRTETHIDMLDGFGGLDKLVHEFGAEYQNASSLIHQIDELQSKRQQILERRELYEFQIREIDAVGPQSGEEDRLETELKILENAEKLFGETEKLYTLLYEGENALHDQLVQVRNQLESLVAIDASFDESKNEAASASAIVNELAKFIQQYHSKIESNPMRLEEIRTRLGQMTLLKRKYGGSLDAVIAHREKIGKEASLAENFNAELDSMQNKLDVARKKCSEIAQLLTEKRRDAAKKINKSVEQALVGLGIAHPKFETRIEHRKSLNADHGIIKLGKDWYEATSNGMDFVEFYISTNVGEDAKPLVKVASGGEVSRIMLALKTILTASDNVPLLIFDEVDIGVSGRIALAVGQSLKNLSQSHQVVAITHLPQIAGLADQHFVVQKAEEGKRSFTRIKKLNLDERVVEVAKLMSGEDVTEAGLRSAKELIRK